MFDSEMHVELIDSMGNDNSVCQAARVSTGNDVAGYKESKGLLNYLWREGHTSPFEHVTATFRVEVPIFIARQIMRHRTFSYNEISGRYSELEPKFWLPDTSRPLENKGSGAYPDLQFHENHDEVMDLTGEVMEHMSKRALSEYKMLVEDGVATEVARAILPQNTYTSFYMTGNLKNFLDFIDKRIVQNAQEEVRDVAQYMAQALDNIVPVTMEVWKENR
mgnify:FL=1